MFDEIKKYKNNGHFFFRSGDNLRLVSKDVPELPGVYYIIRLDNNRVELVYIGKSGSVEQNGLFKKQTLRGRLNNNHEGLGRQEYFNQKCKDENIDALDIYWFVTIDKTNHDLPAYVEGLLIQRFFEIHARLPEWNKLF